MPMAVTDARHAAELVFHQLYERIGNLGDPCIYCGVESSTWDHVPPLHFVSRLGHECRDRFWLRLLPACPECNGLLGGILKTHVIERRSHVRRRLERKYARLLRIPDWDDTELNQLSQKLQFDIRSRLRAKAFIRQRINFYAANFYLREVPIWVS